MNKNKQIKFIEDNYPAYTNHFSNREIRHEFFTKIETEIQAYLLGFYAADGSIDEKRKTLRVELANKDSEIVYLFRDFISKDARIYENKERSFMGPKGKLIHTNGSTGIDITSAKLCESLVNLGIGYNKTFNEFEIPSQIPEDLIIHFIRGYFDGDGSFTGSVYSDKSRPNPRVIMKFTIDSKKDKILHSIMSYLVKEGLNINFMYLKRDDMYRIYTGSKKTCADLFNLLYKDANFYLSRKFDKFNYYVNTEVSQIIADHRNAQEVNANESNNLPTSAEHPINEDENIC